VKKEGSSYRKLWIGIGILVLLAPIGLILPELLKASGAWGEWGAHDIKNITGYLPKGLKRLSELWSAPLSDYTFSGWNKGVKSYIAYMISGLIGVVLAVAVSYVLGKVLKRKNNDRTE
jgi:hypothetical protein